MEGMKEIIDAINSGGNAALLVCIWYMYKGSEAQKIAAERLARIEKALSKFLEESTK